ncbi:hypothetical protein ACFYKX_08315 [Cytobacillus sp. FJAT-54145]|uniref:Uncharacterized protein n=1 Tax=Cytobacillus spartinae TaxID=3299023 RepID=A0ABW6KCV7_9BACI
MEYMFLYLMVGAILAFVIQSKMINRWIKGLISTYYLVITFVFINGRRNIEEQYYAVPVPDEYWDRNSGWVYFIDGFFFWPLIAILLFSYVKWILNSKDTFKRVWIIISILPVGGILLFCAFLFGFGYGYRP